MAEAPEFIRDRRRAAALLSLIGSGRRRVFLVLLLAVCGGCAFASYTQFVDWLSDSRILEVSPTTVYVNRYLGRPLEGGDYLEADPALAPSQPNLHRFFQTVANRIKSAVGDERTNYTAWITGIQRANGWPFPSRVISYHVQIAEGERVDGRKPRYHRFLAGEDGHPPERPWAWWANFVFGGTLIGVTVLGILELVASILQKSLHAVAGFPVIVPAIPSENADSTGDCVIPQELSRR